MSTAPQSSLSTAPAQTNPNSRCDSLVTRHLRLAILSFFNQDLSPLVRQQVPDRERIDGNRHFGAFVQRHDLEKWFSGFFEQK
ncbi:unnamed protein product [Penicillium viridicatum]